MKKSRQYRPHYRPYIDSKMFAHQLREGSDILGQGLLANNPIAGVLESVFANKNLPPNKGKIAWVERKEKMKREEGVGDETKRKRKVLT